jgi:hypothetical protein
MKRSSAKSLVLCATLLVACSDKHVAPTSDGGLGRDRGSATTGDDGTVSGAEDGGAGSSPGSSSSGEDGDPATGEADSGATDGASGANDGDGASPPPGTGAGDGGAGGTADAGAVPADAGAAVQCGDHVCACANGADDDGDGRADLGDPECISSWDDDEDSFATGMPGDNRDDACQDCFFDGNSGSGNDGCRTPTSCLLTGLATSGQGSCSSCEQPQRCVDYCRAYTPNGCDCFGCCEVRVTASDVRHVLLGGGCDLDGTTLKGCTECVPNPTCNNPCGRCELCPGKTEADLPADCTGTPPSDAGTPSEPPGHSCDQGATVCGEGYALCPSGALCQFGCCVSAPTL